MTTPTWPRPAADVNDRVQRMLEELRGEFDVVRTAVPVAGRTIVLHHPRSADALIDEDAFAEDERLPYWADVWPSAIVLAGRVIQLEGASNRLLELGCGAGLVAVAATLAGFEVTATDYYADALRFTELNVLANTGVLVIAREADWRRFPHDLGRFDVVVGSDVLYEREHAELVASAIDRTMTGRGRSILADPGRLAAADFVARCAERGMEGGLVDRVAFDDGAIRQTIDIYEMRRR